MNYTIGIQESLKNIFSAVVVGAIDKNKTDIEEKRKVFRTCLPRFLAQFNDNIFEDEYAFIFEVLKTLKVKIFTLNQLDEIVERNRDVILKSDKVNMSQWASSIDGRPTTDDEKLEAFRLNLIDKVVELSNNVVTEQEYISSVEIFVKYYIEQMSLETVQNMAIILSDTGLIVKKKNRNVLYKGVEDSKKYYNEQQNILNSLSEQDKIQDVLIDTNWLNDELKVEEQPDEDGILDFGLTEIDSVVGSLRRSNMLTILGPPKGGKTRMSNYLVQRALEKGLNVCVWPLEGSKEEWIANQVASMIRTEHGMTLDSKKILERKYESDIVREYVLAAKTRLATDYSRGKLSFIIGTAYSESFIESISAHYDKVNPFDIIVIDQLVNIQSKSGKNKVDRISSAYMYLKDFITNKMTRKAVAILPAQLKQDVVDYLRRNPEETIDVTAGGESAETIRSVDEVIGLFSTKEERASNRMKIYSIASRHSATFDDFTARCELGCCYFESDPDLNV